MGVVTWVGSPTGSLDADEEIAKQDACNGRVVAPDLLVLDDLGALRLNDWVLEQLSIFVTARYKNQRAIVVATDLSPDALARRINWRTVGRLHDICGEPLTLTFAERTHGCLRGSAQTQPE